MFAATLTELYAGLSAQIGRRYVGWAWLLARWKINSPEQSHSAGYGSFGNGPTAIFWRYPNELRACRIFPCATTSATRYTSWQLLKMNVYEQLSTTPSRQGLVCFSYKAVEMLQGIHGLVRRPVFKPQRHIIFDLNPIKQASAHYWTWVCTAGRRILSGVEDNGAFVYTTRRVMPAGLAYRHSFRNQDVKRKWQVSRLLQSLLGRQRH